MTAATLAVCPMWSAAAAVTFKATYTVSLAGLTIGTADAESRFTDGEYAAVIKGKTSGVSRIISDARAVLLGSGRISGKQLTPSSYDLEIREGEFETDVRMKMRNGAVTDLLVIPRLRDDPDRMPLDSEHKRDVVDPVAAFLVVSSNPGLRDGRRICERNIKIFDGWQRYDIRLSYKQTRSVKGTGDAYDGQVVACSARYVPVAGHNMSLDATRYMTKNKRLEVWYAPVGDIKVLVPYRILIGTQYGDLVIVATRFVATDANAKSGIGN